MLRADLDVSAVVGAGPGDVPSACGMETSRIEPAAACAVSSVGSTVSGNAELLVRAEAGAAGGMSLRRPIDRKLPACR